MPMDLSEMSLEAVLRSYSSVKGHRTRCEHEIENLLGLLSTRYSSVSEERIKDRLESLEKHTLRLSDIKDYLIHLKYAKARDHDDEVQEFLVTLDKCRNRCKFLNIDSLSHRLVVGLLIKAIQTL